MIATVVVDASSAVRATIDVESGHADAARAFSTAIERGWDVVAPDVFPYEVGSALARTGEVGRAALLVEALQYVELRRPSPESFVRALALSRPKGSFYDAAYVALAEESGGLLWTEDKEILRRFPERAVDTRELLRRLTSAGP